MERYEPVRTLGRGAFGVARLVRARCSGQLRVVKEVDLSATHQGAQQEAKTEAEVLQSLSHRNIVAYFESFIELSVLHIVMEYADGGDLEAVIKNRRSNDQGRFTDSEALAMLAQICLGLQHAHDRHILHRDVKSANIFLTTEGVVKLGDYGIAKVLDATTAKADTNIGTPLYASPEVCNSEPYGLKADVWSAGVVFYELLALEVPFQAGNLVVLVLRIVESEPKPVPEDCGEAVRDVLSQVLTKDPRQRPSARELLAIRAVGKAAPAPTTPPPEREEAEEPAHAPALNVQCSPAKQASTGAAAQQPAPTEHTGCLPPLLPAAAAAMMHMQQKADEMNAHELFWKLRLLDGNAAEVPAALPPLSAAGQEVERLAEWQKAEEEQAFRISTLRRAFGLREEGRAHRPVRRSDSHSAARAPKPLRPLPPPPRTIRPPRTGAPPQRRRPKPASTITSSWR